MEQLTIRTDQHLQIILLALVLTTKHKKAQLFSWRLGFFASCGVRCDGLQLLYYFLYSFSCIQPLLVRIRVALPLASGAFSAANCVNAEDMDSFLAQSARSLTL